MSSSCCRQEKPQPKSEVASALNSAESLASQKFREAEKYGSAEFNKMSATLKKDGSASFNEAMKDPQKASRDCFVHGTEENKCCSLIFAIALPPLGILLRFGLNDAAAVEAFTVSILLMFICWIPGSIYAFYKVYTAPEPKKEAEPFMNIPGFQEFYKKNPGSQTGTPQQKGCLRTCQRMV